MKAWSNWQDESYDFEKVGNRFSIPLFIAVDQEGGLVEQMRKEVTSCPSQREVAKDYTSEGAKSLVRMTGIELEAMGINVNFAPVLDLSSTQSRSYSEKKEVAASFVKSVVEGYQ